MFGTDFFIALALFIFPICFLAHCFLRSFWLALVVSIIVIFAIIFIGLFVIQDDYPMLYPYIEPTLHYKQILIAVLAESIVIGFLTRAFKKPIIDSRLGWLKAIILIVAVVWFSVWLALFFLKRDIAQSPEMQAWQKAQNTTQTITHSVGNLFDRLTPSSKN